MVAGGGGGGGVDIIVVFARRKKSITIAKQWECCSLHSARYALKGRRGGSCDGDLSTDLSIGNA